MLKNTVFIFFFLFCISILACYAQEDEQVVEELNPSLFNHDFLNYDQKTALYCAQLSELAYWDSARIESFHRKIRTAYPEENHHFTFLDNTRRGIHTQALLWGTKDFMVIAFRGTEPTVFGDLLTDGKFWVYENTSESMEALANMPPGHGGFRKSLIGLIQDKDLFGEMDKLISRSNPDIDFSQFKIYLTGHSLGAAISQLFIQPLEHKNYNFSGAYHFAPPLSVACSVREEMRNKYGNKTYDIVNYKDYVPRAGRFGVAHFGKFYRICDDGLVYKEKEAYVKFNLTEYTDAIKLHSLKNHIIAIRDEQNNREAIVLRSGTEEYPCMGALNELSFCIE